MTKQTAAITKHPCKFSTSSVDGVLIKFKDLTKLGDDQFKNLPNPKFNWEMIQLDPNYCSGYWLKGWLKASTPR